MLEQTPFYYKTLRNTTAVFGNIFNDIRLLRQDEAGDYTVPISVPLRYSGKEKFYNKIKQESSITDDINIQSILPAMGFEMISINMDHERKIHTMNKIVEVDGAEDRFAYMSVPYTVDYNLYVATRRLEDSLMIIEQILPYFTPEFNVTVNDFADFGMSKDIPFVLNSAGFTPEGALGDFSERRAIGWELAFTAYVNIYAPVQTGIRIKKSTINMKDLASTDLFQAETSEVVPDTANEDDPHTIETSVVYS